MEDTTYEDLSIVSGQEGEVERSTYYGALQRLINNGQIWQMEGYLCRAAMYAIEDGLVMTGQQDHRDHWGNLIPARGKLRDGSRGTYGYVVRMHGQDHADELIEAEK